MDRKGYKGSITVFLSLACILFLSLICAVVESARVQGAKAQTANIAGMGTFSLLGEYENDLLEKFEIFSLDGRYGNGSFRVSKVNERLQKFISCNANPREGISELVGFDPWNLELLESRISEYALLTDEKGEPFYQQAVAYMKENAAVMAVEKLLEYTEDIDLIRNGQKEYENSRKNNDTQMQKAQEQADTKIRELESEAKAAGEQADGTSQSDEADAVIDPERGTVENASDENPSGKEVQEMDSDTAEAIEGMEDAKKLTNPLKEIARLRKKSALDIVTWDKSISSKKIKTSGLPSKGTRQKGNMKLPRKYSGLTANLLFREYLLQFFSNYVTQKEGGSLDYQIEYVLGGKSTDKKNLKYTADRLLLLREGMNYMYCVNNPEIERQTALLAAGLTGFLGMPAVTELTKQALLLAWAYGESLIDVRILLDQGRVPIQKDASGWSLSLENLGRLTEILQQGAPENTTGLSYMEYLRILLNMGNLSSQKMRALDLIQDTLQKERGNTGFKVQNCIVALKAETKWNCRQVFMGLPGAVMGAGGKGFTFVQESSITY